MDEILSQLVINFDQTAINYVQRSKDGRDDGDSEEGGSAARKYYVNCIPLFRISRKSQ